MPVDDPKRDFQSKLKSLKSAYARRLPEKAQGLEALAMSLSSGGDDEHAWRLLEAEAHKLAGSAGSYGFPDIGVIARELEHLAQRRTERELPSRDALNFILEKLRKRIETIH